jgi:two-component system, OmpR family, phosphate regulon response regulator PhoB
MDIRMPGDMNGLDATRLLKADARTNRSKIIVLTSSTGARDEAMNAGADVYLAKPFSPLGLLQKIDELIEKDCV